MTPADTITFRAIPIQQATMSTNYVAIAVEETGQRWGDDLLAITLGSKPRPVHIAEEHLLRAPETLSPVEVETYRNTVVYHLSGLTLEEMNRVACFIQIDGEDRYMQMQEEERKSIPDEVQDI